MAKWMGIDVPLWLIVAITLGLVLLVGLQSPSSGSGSGSDSRRANKSRSKERKDKEEEPPISDAAKDVARRLGVSVSVVPGRVRRRVPVTVCVKDVVLRKARDGEWVAIESAVRALTLLNEVASVFLVSWVESDVDESLVKDVALASGLVIPTSSIRAAAPAAVALTAVTPTGIPEHRLLFCSSHIGQVAVVRQLTPSLHIGGPVALLEGICRFVPSLVRIDPCAVELPADGAPAVSGGVGSQPAAKLNASSGSYSGDNNSNSTGGGCSLEWREFTSLAAAAGLPPTKATHTPTPVAEVAKPKAEAEAMVQAEGGLEGEGKGEMDTGTRKPAMASGSGSSISSTAVDVTVVDSAAAGNMKPDVSNLVCVEVELGDGTGEKVEMEVEVEVGVDEAGTAPVKA